MADVLSVILRVAGLVLMLQAAGAVLFLTVFRGSLQESEGRIRSLGWITALVAIATVAGHGLLEAARMAGDMTGVFDLSLQRLAWISSSGAAWGMRIAAMWAVIVVLRSQGRGKRSVALTASGVVSVALTALSFTLIGHTADNTWRPILAPLLVIHLLVVTFWFGALIPLCLVTLREPRAVAAAVVARFSSLATWLVPLIFVAGAGMAALLLPNLSVLSQPYGLLLLIKVALFGVLMMFAAMNRWRLGPAVGQEGTSAAPLRRSMRYEHLLIIVVLVATAVMTTFFSPE